MGRLGRPRRLSVCPVTEGVLVVAVLALLGVVLGHVVLGVLVVGLVARIAVGRRAGVAVRMAGRAGEVAMGTLQDVAGDRMVEGRARPGALGVAALAGRGESRRGVIRIGRRVVV